MSTEVGIIKELKAILERRLLQTRLVIVFSNKIFEPNF